MVLGFHRLQELEGGLEGELVGRSQRVSGQSMA